MVVEDRLKKGFYKCLYRRRTGIKLLSVHPWVNMLSHCALWAEECSCHLPVMHEEGAGGAGWFLEHLHR